MAVDPEVVCPVPFRENAPGDFLSRTAPIPEALAGGRFVIEDLIGEGGFSKVYRALDWEDGGHCAVKLLEADRLDEERNTERFIAEARALSRLRHPRIVRVRTGGKEQGYYWFAMDYLPSGSLERHIASKGPLRADRAVSAIFQVLQALWTVHGAGLVHRDVKPGNILVDAEGFVCLSDFGIARHPVGSVSYVTVTEQVLGTRGYTAPEQIDDPRRVGPSADIFGAGATLYHLLTATRPDRLYLTSLTASVLEPIPWRLRAVVQRAVELDPDKRYPNARRMARAMVEAMDEIRSRKGEPPRADAWMARF